MPCISAKTMGWGQTDSEEWGLLRFMWNSGRNETERSRMWSYWGLPCLYLDLVLRLGTLAAECFDQKSIWLQVWFLLGAFGTIKVHTMGRSALILCFQALNIIFPFYWWHSWGATEPSATELEQYKVSTCHFVHLHELEPDLFCNVSWSPMKRNGSVDHLI